MDEVDDDEEYDSQDDSTQDGSILIFRLSKNGNL